MENVPISKLILFVSTVPEARMCRSLMNYLQSKNIFQRLNGGLQIIRLDSEESRQRARNGKYFSITQVPSLVVILENDLTKIYNGADKISQYLTMLVTPPPEEPSYYEGGRYVGLEAEAERNKFYNSKNKNKKIVIGGEEVERSDSIGNEIPPNDLQEFEPVDDFQPIEIEEVEEEDAQEQEEVEVEEKPKKSKKASKKTTKKSSKKSTDSKKKITLKTSQASSDLMQKAAAMQAQFDTNIELTTPRPKK